MPQYTIRGTTFDGQSVDTIIDAPSQEDALRVANRTYKSRLKKPFDILVVSQATTEQIQRPVVGVQGYRTISMREADVIRIGSSIKANIHVDQNELMAFRRYCDTLTNGILNRLWNDIFHVTKEDKAEELFENIVTEFIPAYIPMLGKGRIRTFLWKKVNYRVLRDWKRAKYVNADSKEKAEPKAALLWEFIRRMAPESTGNEELTEREKIIQLSLQIAPHREKLKPKERRELFGLVVGVGLHRELLSSEKQKKVFDLMYGQEMNEIEVAREIGVFQSTVNLVKKRAERTYFKAVVKNFSEQGHSSIFQEFVGE